MRDCSKANMNFDYACFKMRANTPYDYVRFEANYGSRNVECSPLCYDAVHTCSSFPTISPAAVCLNATILTGSVVE
jgi:hypothetical protein